MTRVYVCGLAYDYCVGSTAESAAKAGFQTMLVRDATKFVAKETEAKMDERLRAAGVIIVDSKDCA